MLIPAAYAKITSILSSKFRYRFVYIRYIKTIVSGMALFPHASLSDGHLEMPFLTWHCHCSADNGVTKSQFYISFARGGCLLLPAKLLQIRKTRKCPTVIKRNELHAARLRGLRWCSTRNLNNYICQVKGLIKTGSLKSLCILIRLRITARIKKKGLMISEMLEMALNTEPQLLNNWLITK